MNPINLIIKYIDFNYILIDLNPPLPNLKNNEIEFILNNLAYTNFSLIDESSGLGMKYSIIPSKPFNLYDLFTMQILKENFNSDKVKAYVSKTFTNHSADIFFQLPDNKAGTYTLNLSTVNGMPFNLESDEFTLCKLLDMNNCKAYLQGSGVYHANEEINIGLELISIDNELIPDGFYLVGIKQQVQE